MLIEEQCAVAEEKDEIKVNIALMSMFFLMKDFNVDYKPLSLFHMLITNVSIW